MVLEKVSFSPSESVSYTPDATKQSVPLVITNSGTEFVTFKLKSTRPGVYKMRPVYGMVKPGDQTTIKLIFKGLKPTQQIQQMLKDHYTIIYTVAPGSTTNVQKMWTSHKFHAKMVGNEMRKYQLRILFKGYNDVEQSHDPASNHSLTHRRAKIVKGEGLVDQETTGKTPTIIQPAQQGHPAVLLMYRDVAPMSESESEGEDSDDEKQQPASGPPPPAQSQQTKSTPAQSQKLPAVSQQTKSTAPTNSTTPVSKSIPDMRTAPMANLGNKALPPKK